MTRFFLTAMVSLALLSSARAFSPQNLVKDFLDQSGIPLDDKQKTAIGDLANHVATEGGVVNLLKLANILKDGKVNAGEIPGLLRLFADIFDSMSKSAGGPEKALKQLTDKLNGIGITDDQLASIFGIGKGSAVSEPLFQGDLQSAWKRIGLDEPTLKQFHTAKSKPIIIAMIDTGIDYFHPDLRGQLWVNPKEKYNGKDDDGNGYVDDINGFNFAEMNSNILDNHGHGTYAAGIIAGKWNKLGIAGVNPNVKLMILRDTNKKGQEQALATALAIDYAIKHGAKIIHLSNTYSNRAKAVEVMVKRALKKGILVVATANSRSRNTANVIPASVPGVLTVGALDREDKRCIFSGWGAHLDVMAPGTSIPGPRAYGTDFLTLMAGRDPNKEQSKAILNKRWYIADGTCSSAPLVTGVASLLWQKYPKLTAEQIKHMILMSCDDLGRPGWDKTTGMGKLNIQKALKANPNHYLFQRSRKERVKQHAEQ